jgi:hypothetical protein
MTARQRLDQRRVHFNRRRLDFDDRAGFGGHALGGRRWNWNWSLNCGG